MPYGLYISAEGAHAQDKRLQVIANNLANVDTVGFKRELAVFQARYAEAIEQGSVLPGFGKIDDIGGGVMVVETKTDFSPAALKQTDVPTDLAIEGDGFFAVLRDGTTYLTRAGNFRLTSAGALVTQQGYPVLSEGGNPVAINPAGGDWEIGRDGVLRQEGGGEFQLAIVKPATGDRLLHVGENLFQPTTEPEPIAPTERRVAGGYLEQSGVRPTTEMIGLIEASRILEANINVMKAQDQMLGGLVSHVLRV